MGMMAFTGLRVMGKLRDVTNEKGALETEVIKLRRQIMADENWQEMMPFACDDAKTIGVFSDRTPTEQDRITAMCQVVWINLRTSDVWKSVEPGVWLEAGTNRHYPRDADVFVAITEDDDFLFMHGGNYPGFRDLIDYITNGSPEGLRHNDQRARGINPMPFILMDAGTSEGHSPGQQWQMIRGLVDTPAMQRVAQASAPDPAPPSSPSSNDPFRDRPRPIVLD